MMRERRAPGVEHGSDADTGAQVFGVGRDGERGLGSRVNREVHARIWERPGVRFLRANSTHSTFSAEATRPLMSALPPTATGLMRHNDVHAIAKSCQGSSR